MDALEEACQVLTGWETNLIYVVPFGSCGILPVIVKIF